MLGKYHNYYHKSNYVSTNNKHIIKILTNRISICEKLCKVIKRNKNNERLEDELIGNKTALNDEETVAASKQHLDNHDFLDKQHHKANYLVSGIAAMSHRKK